MKTNFNDVRHSIGGLTANDPGDYDKIIAALQSADSDADVDGLRFGDDEEDVITLWEPLQGRYSVGQFREMIGLHLSGPLGEPALYEVRLISKSVQSKYVIAKSPEEAQRIADEDQWNEKEEMLDSDHEISQVESPEHPDKYVVFESENGEIDVARFNELPQNILNQ